MKTPIQALIVEDVDDDAKLIVAELKRGGYAVNYERVDTASAMRTALLQKSWDVILCDFTMPYLNGSAALKLARECDADVPFIYVSGTIGEDIAIEAMKSGAQDYVMKTNLARLGPALDRELHEAAIRRESRRADIAMRESEHKYRHLFEALSDAVLLIDEESGRVIDTNTRTEHLLGRTREEIIGTNQSNLFASKNGKPGYASLCATARGEHPGGCELDVFRHDEQTVPVHVSASRIELYSRPLLLTLLRDVSERNRMEEQVRQLSRAVEQSPSSIIITDTSGKIIYVNSKFIAVTGYAFSEAVGANPRILKSGNMPPETYVQLWQTITSGREWRGELHNKKKNGELYWESASISPILNEAGQITHFLAVKEDITERKKNEARIKEQAALIDLTQDAILVRDLEHRILLWNKGAERIYGWTAAEALGRPVHELIYRDKSQLTAAMEALLKHETWRGELHLVTKAGTELTVESSWTLIRNPDGTPKSVLSINTDVTERKKIEQQFLRAQRLESIGTLAGGIAHDLNNLLSPIVMGADLLKQIAPNPQMLPVIENMARSAKRGTDLVRQVLSFARGAESTKIALQVRTIIREIESIIENTFPKNITLKTEVAADLWLVMADPTQINQVLLNLCVNARDAMPDGGHLDLAARNVEIDANHVAMNRNAAPGRYVMIQVSDSGCGMSRAVLDRIFEPFYTTKPIGKGTGLGLSTVLGIVRSHGGFVDVTSEPGKGSMFKVFLPAQEERVVAVHPDAAPGPFLHGNGELLMVVDDEISILDIIRETLLAFGYRVITAKDGAQAISIYNTHRNEIAAVLTDMMMPIIGGPELIAALLRINPSAKIIATSGLDAKASEAHMPVSHFLPKPYSAETLLKMLKMVLTENAAPVGSAVPGK